MALLGIIDGNDIVRNQMNEHEIQQVMKYWRYVVGKEC